MIRNNVTLNTFILLYILIFIKINNNYISVGSLKEFRL